MMSVANP